MMKHARIDVQGIEGSLMHNRIDAKTWVLTRLMKIRPETGPGVP